MQRYFRLILAPLALLPGLLSPAAPAAEETDLYRVELLLFVNEGNQGAEQWAPYPELAYPESARFLIDPDYLETTLAAFPGDAELDDRGRQLISMPEESEEDAEQRPAPPAGTPEVTEDAEPEPEPPVRLYHLLPRSEREINTWGVSRSERYRILFHEAWIQPVGEAEQALPIVLDRSGNSGDWPLWQGSIRLFRKPFLQLETNLWLNTQAGYFPPGWQMPPPPIGPASVLVDGLPPHEYLALQAAEEEAERLLLEGTPAPPATAAAAPPQPPEPSWPFRHSVLLQQERGMRSGEVHYLDHPLLGLVIKLTPFDPEAPAP